MEEEKTGLTIGQFFKIVLSRKWLALVIAAVITVCGTLALWLGFGESRKYYEGRFSLMFAEGNDVYYPDGALFNYKELVSRRNLLEIKGMSESFGNVDVEKMYSQGDVDVLRADSTTTTAEWKYTVSVKASYFKNEAQARDFIEYIMETPVRYLKSIASDRDMYFDVYETTDFYEEKAELLKKRVDYLKEISGMIKNTGNTLMKACRTLEIGLEDIEEKLNSTIVDIRDETAAAETTRELLVHSAEEVKARYKQLLKAAETERDNLMDEYNLLKGDTVNVYGEAVSSRIAKLAKDIAECNKNITMYELYLVGDGSVVLKEDPSVKQTLDGYKTKIEEISSAFAEDLEEGSLGTVLVCEGSLNSEGNITLLAGFFISLAVGVVVAVVIAFIAGYGKLKKSAETPETAQENKDGNADGGNADNA